MTSMRSVWRPVTLWPMDQLLVNIESSLELLEDDVADSHEVIFDDVFGLESVLATRRPVMAAHRLDPDAFDTAPTHLTDLGLIEIERDIVELNDNSQIVKSHDWRSSLEQFVDRTRIARRVSIRIDPKIETAFAELHAAWTDVVAESNEDVDDQTLQNGLVAKYVALLSITIPNVPLEKLLSSSQRSRDPKPPYMDYKLKCLFTYGPREKRQTAEVGMRLELDGGNSRLVALLPPLLDPPLVQVVKVQGRGSKSLKQCRDDLIAMIPPDVETADVDPASLEGNRRLRQNLRESIVSMNACIELGDFDGARSLAIDVYVLRQKLGQSFGNS